LWINSNRTEDFKHKYEDLIHHSPSKEVVYKPIHEEIPVHKQIEVSVLKEMPHLGLGEIVREDFTHVPQKLHAPIHRKEPIYKYPHPDQPVHDNPTPTHGIPHISPLLL
jgi:hypothetical protein